MDAQPRDCGADACRELGVAFVAFSPVARAFSVASWCDVGTLDARDIRRHARFAPEAYAANLAIAGRLPAIAAEVGCTPRNWRWPGCCTRQDIIPIPGTTSVEHLHDDLGPPGAAGSAVIERLDALINERTVVGKSATTRRTPAKSILRRLKTAREQRGLCCVC